MAAEDGSKERPLKMNVSRSEATATTVGMAACKPARTASRKLCFDQNRLGHGVSVLMATSAADVPGGDNFSEASMAIMVYFDPAKTPNIYHLIADSMPE